MKRALQAGTWGGFLKVLQVGFGFFGDGGEDGEELVGFVLETRKTVGGNDVGVGKEVEPVAGFVQFLEAVADFQGEFGPGAAAMSFPVIGSDGGTTTQELFSKDAGFIGVR